MYERLGYCAGFVSLLAFAGTLHGCGLNCTQIGCLDGVTLVFEGTWSPGQYRVDIDADGRQTACTFGVAPDSTIACTGDKDVEIFSSGLQGFELMGRTSRG